MRRQLVGLGVVLLSLACGGWEEDSDRRAILVSVDALNEAIFSGTLTREDAPNLHGLFQSGACAEHAVSHYPSVTAAAHATLWTGAFGDVTGVTTNTMPQLPRSRHTVLEGQRGFSYEALRAEALWITAGRAGVPVAGHHVTQAPGVPGYLPVDSVRTLREEAARREAEEILGLPHVQVMNGYNRSHGTHRVITAGSSPLTDPEGWIGLESLSSHPHPRAFAWDAGPDSVFGLLTGEGGRYDRAILGLERDVAKGVVALPHPVEGAPFEGRELARHFTPPLPLEVGGDRLHLWFRLFHLDPEGEEFMLYHPSLDVVDFNRTELLAAFHDAVGGWFGNGAHHLYRRGAFGPPLWEGGDGTAEARYLETAELLTRQFNRGSRWLWEQGEPRLLMDYFPLSDDVDHTVLGYLEPAWPGYDSSVAEALSRFRARVWGLVDLRVGMLRELATRDGRGALFVAGDHGMRPSWRVFRPNRVLETAGLLVRGADGAVDLSRTRAYSNGYFVMVNRTAWREGIVPPEQEAEVVAAIRTALEDLRDPGGAPVVTATHTPDERPELGMGGATGGDVYWELAPFTRPSWELDGAPVGDAPIDAGHGFIPTDPDMFTVFCAVGPTVRARRIPPVRLTAVAPTLAEWVGIPPPADAVDGSVLGHLMGGR